MWPGVREPAPIRESGQNTGGIWAELREGLAVVLENPLLRSIAGCTGTSNLFGNAIQAKSSERGIERQNCRADTSLYYVTELNDQRGVARRD